MLATTAGAVESTFTTAIQHFSQLYPDVSVEYVIRDGTGRCGEEAAKLTGFDAVIGASYTA